MNTRRKYTTRKFSVEDTKDVSHHELRELLFSITTIEQTCKHCRKIRIEVAPGDLT